MHIDLSFLGAAQNVTGSRFLLEANGVNILVDCGLYQERQFLDRNWSPFLVPADKIDVMLLTHAHLDHCGLIPKLVKEGFRGNIYCTHATAEIAQIVLLDAGKLQEEDAAYKAKRHKKEGREGTTPAEVPLYTLEDAVVVEPYFKGVDYRESVSLGPGVEATFYDAGHVLGSSMIRVKVIQGGEERIILFGGDIGRGDRPIVCDPTVFDKADYVLVESTYGDRVHQPTLKVRNLIRDVVNATRKRGGNIVVPSFAMERSQEVLYHVSDLIRAGEIEPIRVFVDSPMASKITHVFRHHPELFDKATTDRISNNDSPFSFVGLELAGTSDESKAINDITEPIIIIAGSGMCNGGRVKHHLVNNISRPESTIMFVGYQAIGTLGRLIVDETSPVRILGQEYDVKAKVVRIHGFSAHADKTELLTWLRALETAPRKVFVVHGEESSATNFGKFLRKETGWPVEVPEFGYKAVLD